MFRVRIFRGDSHVSVINCRADERPHVDVRMNHIEITIRDIYDSDDPAEKSKNIYASLNCTVEVTEFKKEAKKTA